MEDVDLRYTSPRKWTTAVGSGTVRPTQFGPKPPHTLLWISDPVRPCFLAITSSDLAQLVPNFHTLHFSPSADIHQYGLLTKYQNLGYLSLTRNVKFRPVHLSGPVEARTPEVVTSVARHS